MEEPVFVKCEPAWSSDTEEPTNFENSQLVSEVIPLKQEREPGPAFEERVELESAVARGKEEMKSKLTEPGLSQPATFVKTEITTEEHTPEQLIPLMKEENSVDDVAVFTTCLVDSYEACCNTVTPKSVVKSHLLTHKEKMCDAVYSDKLHPEKHMLTHSSNKPYCCSICSSTFSQKSHLKTHINTHSNERPYCCTLCGSKFSQNSNLKSHMRTHFDERPHCCSLCGSKFSRKTHLESHLLTHSKEKPYSCTLCSSKFSQKSTLNSHLKIHSIEKRYRCTLCSSKFSLKSYLNKHMQTHTNERPHCCTLCERKFARKGELKRHMLVVHCKERPHSCTLCSRKFSRKIYLREHMVTHCTVNSTVELSAAESCPESLT